MSLDLPSSATEVVQRAKTDVQRILSGSNPFLKNSVLGALITGIANRIFDFYLQLREAIDVLFPDTSEGEFLERWAAIYGKTRQAATTASGSAFATGVAGGFIPVGTTFTSSDGNIYEATASATIAAEVIAVTSITRSGTVATVTTTSPHNLGPNAEVTIAGADQSEYNITTSIIVLNTTQFTYTVDIGAVTPATGTITAIFTGAAVPVESQAFQDSTLGVNVNLELGAPLTLQSPIVNVDDTLNVNADTVSGGEDQETDNELQIRLLDRIQNPVAHFSAAEITEVAKEVAGVTRVFVEEVTPAVGQVTTYFMRDNDPNPIPSASEVTEVADKIATIIPANTDPADVFTSAPTAVPVAFTFTALSPNTSTMQAAISANLAQFFSESTVVSVNITDDSYRAAINNTIDPNTGTKVESFTLSLPIGDVVIATGEIGTLGSIIYP